MLLEAILATFGHFCAMNLYFRPCLMFFSIFLCFCRAPSWFSSPGCFWALLEPSWASLERVLDALGRLSAALGALLGRSRAALGPSWDALRTSWKPLALILNLNSMPSTFWASTWGPKWRQVGTKILKKIPSKINVISGPVFHRFLIFFHRFWHQIYRCF